MDTRPTTSTKDTLLIYMTYALILIILYWFVFTFNKPLDNECSEYGINCPTSCIQLAQGVDCP